MGDARRVRDAAAALLLEQRLYSLKIDLLRLRYPEWVRFDTLQRFCTRTRATLDSLLREAHTRDGCTLLIPKGDRLLHLVLYNQDSPPRRRAFTLAHEVGHIRLAHRDDDRDREAEADLFAAELLAPRALVLELRRRAGGLLSPADLCAVFALSPQAAALALRRQANLREDALSPTERRLLRRLSGLLPDFDGPVVDC